LLHGHLQDRVGMPLVHTGRTREEMEAIAIEEWMAASPVYSLRTQRALRFGNGDVPTILKNIQLDIGAPPHFMDFRCRVEDEYHGEFWLAHCGALLDVEPMGEDYVHGMCHAIEDPTFDATAGATNPRAQVRPCTDRRVSPRGGSRIATGPSRSTPRFRRSTRIRTARSSSSRSSRRSRSNLPGRTETTPSREAGRLLRRFRSRLRARGSLAPRARHRVAGSRVQSHLLLRGFAVAVAQRYGEDVALALLPQIFTGLAGMTRSASSRCSGSRPATRTTSRACSPCTRCFWPRTYVDLRIEVVDDLRVRFALGSAPVFEEADGFTWFSQLGGTATAPSTRSCRR